MSDCNKTVYQQTILTKRQNATKSQIAMKIRLQQKGQIATKRDYVLLKQNRKSDCNKKYNCQSQDRREVIIARTQGYNQYGPFRFRLATERKIVTKGQNAIKIRVQQKRRIAIPP